MEPGNDDALDIIITNVVATFRVRCHLNLRTIALEGTNVIYKPEIGVRKSNAELRLVVAHRVGHVTARANRTALWFSESADEASETQNHSLDLVLGENHLHRSDKVRR